MAVSISSIASNAGALLGRTVMLYTDTATGIPVPIAVLDVVKDENVTYDAEVTEHPVEAGAEVSDHIQLKNPSIMLKGTISSTPLDLSVALANLAAGSLAAISSSQARANLLNSAVGTGASVVGAALQGGSLAAGSIASNAFASAVDAVSRTILIYAYQNKTPFTLITKRQTFKNVVIKRLSFPRNEETGFALNFEMEIKQLRIVSPLKVSKNKLDESVISTASSSTSLGSQSTQMASAQIESAVSSSPLGSAPGMSLKFPGAFG